MRALVLAGARAGVALLLAFIFGLPASAKPFDRPDLAEAAIRLEAQIKSEAGTVSKPATTLKRDADAAFARNDYRNGIQLMGQVVTADPANAAHWLRLAQAVMELRPTNNNERTLLLERAGTTAYIAYQRAENAGVEAEALSILGRTFATRQLWRPALDALRLSLELREVAAVREQYEKMRLDHGFRLLDYTVDADSASPRACFQFSEALPGRRTDFSPFVSMAGQDRPALSVDDHQLCVEGLKHGERYAVTLRAGLPSTVHETLPKSVDLNIYVRDRSPFVRFTSQSYVLPRKGQQGVPIVSVNTRKVMVEVYRVGDRGIADTLRDDDFQRTLDRYALDRLAEERGERVWKGELDVDNKLNADVTTAFPVESAVGTLSPGVYVMVAEPDGPKAEYYEALATQWFIVSDLGLTVYSGHDGIHVFIHSLASAAATPQVQVRLISRSNEVLATRTTDTNGRADFEPGLTRGEGALAPAIIVADNGKGDYAFLSLRSQPFDLSDRGVTGRTVPAGLDAFVFTERGVYRSGETVHLTALLRDATGIASADVPLTIVIERPDGVEYRRVVTQDQGFGGRVLDIELISSAPTGTWRARAYADPKRPSVGETTFMVEDYVPDRLEFELTSTDKAISASKPAALSVDGRYLYGAPAVELALDGEVVVAEAKERPGFAGYTFGVYDEEIEATRTPLEDLPLTSDTGKATFDVSADDVPSATRPLEARITVRMAEPGGRAVERKLSLPVAPGGPMIGVRPLFSGGAVGEGQNATFDVVVVAADGTKLAAKGLHYDLLRIETSYQWYRQDGYWNYEPVHRTQRVADGTVDIAADQPARISVPVTFGRYRLEVSTDDPAGPLTSVGFNAGWYAEAGSDTPDLLEIALDKPEYQPGESMTLAVTARTAGLVTVNIVGDRLLHSISQQVQAGTARIAVPVGADWGTGAYAVATLRRPLDETAGRMPGRALGVKWFAIDRKARALTVNLTLPPTIRPNSELRIPIKLAGLQAGEQARVVVAAVDVGILNLTNYKPPAPETYYLGQRQLTAEIRDLYGQLIDGMQGTRGQIRTGGDESATLQGSPPAQAPLALYSGIVTVGADGSAEVVFDIPDFSGTARVMAVAWTRDKVGQATGDVVIRDAVVVTATLPRFLLFGDKATMRLDFDNVEGPAGEYTVTIASEGSKVVDDGVKLSVRLAAKQRSNLPVPLEAASVGLSTISMKVQGPDSFALERKYALAVKPATQILARRTVRPIAEGESITLSRDLFADLVPGTGGVQLSLGYSSALDAATLVGALDRYPFGCTEQVVSRAVALLYLNDLASDAKLALDAEADDRIRASIDRVLARQDANGSFGLWSAGGDDIWLDAYVTDFLTRAREKGFAVPDNGFKLALDRLRNFINQAPEPSKDGGTNLAYALYVLARNNYAPVGDLRYYADAKLADITTPIAKAQIGAALGMLGDRARAERVYAAALRAIDPAPLALISRVDYGSTLRDAAAVVTLAAESGAERATVFTAVERVETARANTSYTSTQENAWLVLAARALAKEATAVTLDVNGTPHKGAFYRALKAAQLGTPFAVANRGSGPLQAVVTVTGAPLVAESAVERGFKIERGYYTLDGEPVDVTKVKQNQRMAVVIRVTEPSPQFGRIILADYLPAGFEIDNPRLVSSGEVGTLDWIEDAVEPVNAEFRDDRFTAAFARSSNSDATFAVAYVVRAVSPGKYVHPQAYVEDMYRPDRYGRTATGTVEVTTK